MTVLSPCRGRSSSICHQGASRRSTTAATVLQTTGLLAHACCNRHRNMAARRQRCGAACAVVGARTRGPRARGRNGAARPGLGFQTPIVFAYPRRFRNRAAATLVPTTQLATLRRAPRFHNVRLPRRGVDTDVFHPDRRNERLRAQWGLKPVDLAVSHVGRIAPEKNLDLAIDAFRAVRQGQSRERFVIVGDGPSRK